MAASRAASPPASAWPRIRHCRANGLHSADATKAPRKSTSCRRKAAKHVGSRFSAPIRRSSAGAATRFCLTAMPSSRSVRHSSGQSIAMVALPSDCLLARPRISPSARTTDVFLAGTQLTRPGGNATAAAQPVTCGLAVKIFADSSNSKAIHPGQCGLAIASISSATTRAPATSTHAQRPVKTCAATRTTKISTSGIPPRTVAASSIMPALICLSSTVRRARSK